MARRVFVNNSKKLGPFTAVPVVHNEPTISGVSTEPSVNNEPTLGGTKAKEYDNEPNINPTITPEPDNEPIVESRVFKPSGNEFPVESDAVVPKPYDPPFNFGFSDLEWIHIKNLEKIKDGEYWKSLNYGPKSNPDGLSRAQYALINPFGIYRDYYRGKAVFNKVMQVFKSDITYKGFKIRGKDKSSIPNLPALLPTDKELAKDGIDKKEDAIMSKEDFYEAIQEGDKQATAIETQVKDRVSIIKKLTARLYITLTAVYGEGFDEVQIPLTMDNITYTPEVTQSPIHILGRSLKRYHYTGGEDTLEFKVVWKQFSKYDLPMTSALRVATFTRPNEDGEMPIIHLTIPNTKVANPNLTFFTEGASYILTKAPIKAFRFMPYLWPSYLKAYNTESESPNAKLEYLGATADDIGNNVNPQLVEQTLTFKRISDYNLSGRELYRHAT